MTTDTTIAFAFDRDFTIDVNPCPGREAIPLSWVRYLAHETDNPVYAIGNQDLRDEAGIPGVTDIVSRHPERTWEGELGGVEPSGRYERFPQRRERLRMIQDIHPEADRYVVADDLDLSDVKGWEHYQSWAFMPLARDNSFQPALPPDEDLANYMPAPDTGDRAPSHFF
jgi:hypothetical protein